MIQYLNKLEENRNQLLLQTAHLTTEQYNQIPTGFSNNIVWNMGHLLLVGESMLYKSSPDRRPIPEVTVSRYQKGSKPEEFIQEDEISLIRKGLLRSVSSYKSLVAEA